MIDIFAPKHRRTNCSDENYCNGLIPFVEKITHTKTFEDKIWFRTEERQAYKFDCVRCALLDIKELSECPEDLKKLLEYFANEDRPAYNELVSAYIRYLLK